MIILIMANPGGEVGSKWICLIGFLEDLYLRILVGGRSLMLPLRGPNKRERTLAYIHYHLEKGNKHHVRNARIITVNIIIYHRHDSQRSHHHHNHHNQHQNHHN